jgi:chromosome segregation ATPase
VVCCAVHSETELTELNRTTSATIAQLGGDLRNALRDARRVSDDSAGLHSALATAREEHRSCASTIEALHSELAATQSTSAQAIGKLTEELSRTTSKWMASDSALTQAQRTLSEAELKHADTTKGLRDELEAARAVHVHCELTAARLRADCERANNVVTQKSAQLTQMSRALSEVTAAHGHCRQMEEEIDVLRNELHIAQKSAEDRSALAQQIDRMTGEHDKLSAAHDLCGPRLVELKGKMDALVAVHQRCANVASELAATKTELTEAAKAFKVTNETHTPPYTSQGRTAATLCSVCVCVLCVMCAAMRVSVCEVGGCQHGTARTALLPSALRRDYKQTAK